MSRAFPNAWIQTFTGKKFWPVEPEAGDLDIRDIAHALSNMCRFAGHTREFYSVAQHSLLVSELVPKEFGLCALLHDASEAYLVDVPRPIKWALSPGYQLCEDRVMNACAAAFGFEWPMPEAVKTADDQALAMEAKVLMNGSLLDWFGGGFDWESVPAHWRLRNPVPPVVVEELFLARFHDLAKAPA